MLYFKKSIVFLSLLTGICFGQITRVDSIPDFLATGFKGGNAIPLGTGTDNYIGIYSSNTTNYLLTVYTFECTDAGVMPASILDDAEFVIGSGTGVNVFPDIIQVPGTEYFICSWSFDGANDSTWVFLISADTTTGAIGSLIDKKVVKYVSTKNHTLRQIGSSNYYGLTYRLTGSFACGLKIFEIDPGTPEIVDANIDSLDFASIYDVNWLRVGSTDYYLFTYHYDYLYFTTYSISQVDGSISAQVDQLSGTSGPQIQNGRCDLQAANDSIFVAIEFCTSNNDAGLHSVKVSNSDGSIPAATEDDYVLNGAANYFETGAISIVDGVIFASYSIMELVHYLEESEYSIVRVSSTGTFSEVQSSTPLESFKCRSQDVVGFGDYAINIFLEFGDKPWLLSVKLNAEITNWPHSRSGTASVYIGSYSGTSIEDIQEISGVEK